MRASIRSILALLVAVGTVHADEPSSSTDTGSDTAITVRGEVIVIEDLLPPKVRAKPKNYSPRRAPPYSERALVSDAWTKAWMLLDVNTNGEVTRFKFLKRPGYDLEKIAATEVLKLRFEPARDDSDKPVRTLIVWAIEWPSAGWLEKLVGTRTRMPPLVGVPPHVRLLSDYVPCKGSGPWKMDSVHKTYKDCSKPDLANAKNEPWITSADSM